jgi:hypothetical protein
MNYFADYNNSEGRMKQGFKTFSFYFLMFFDI